MLSTAATRRLDHLRAEEKMIQREREAEGDEFMDKEAFVTQAYKDQMAEVRRAEEEVKQREGMRFLRSNIIPSSYSYPMFLNSIGEEERLIFRDGTFLPQDA